MMRSSSGFPSSLLLLGTLIVINKGPALAEKVGQCSAETCLPDAAAAQDAQATTSDCVIQQDADFPGEDFDATADVSSREHCSQVCSGTPGCKAWTFGKTD